MSKGPTKRRPTPRTIEGVPGTVEPGFRERELIEQPLPDHVAVAFALQGLETRSRYFTMGPCGILVDQEPIEGELRWHLTISTPSRHPSWDEIKTARYRLVPDDVCMAMLLPPSRWYVNVPARDHVMQLWEIRDPLEPWRTE
jgi:hypothetical protein